MDGLKLSKWREDFNREAQRLQVVLDSFFKAKKLDEYYEVRVDELSQNLHLEITDETLPEEIKTSLMKMLEETRPEDSI